MSVSTIRSVMPSSFPSFTLPQQQQQQYTTIYNLCIPLKKEYDTTTDNELKDALRIVLSKKNQQMQSIWSSYTSTINVQIQSVAPE